MTSIEKVARDLARVEKRLHDLSTQPSLGHSAIDGGALQLKDIYGNTAGFIGQQFDGTVTAAAVGGPPPPIPTMPYLEPVVGGLKMYWDGTYVSGTMAKMDFRRVTFHVVTDIDDFDATNPAQIMGEVSIATGGEVSVNLLPEEVFVCTVAWSESGKFSVESDWAHATPIDVVDPEMWAEHEAALDDLNEDLDYIETVTLPALALEQDAAASALANLNDVVLPDLQTELDALGMATGDNLVKNGNFTSAATGGYAANWTQVLGPTFRETNAAAPGGTTMTSNPSAGSATHTISDRFPVTSGQRYAFTARTGASSTARVYFRVRYFDATGASIGSTDIFSNVTIPGGTIADGGTSMTRIEGTVLMPSGARKAGVEWFSFVDSGSTYVWLNEVDCRKVVVATQLGPDSVTTDKMTANSINGDRIAANTLHADKVIANTITGDKVAANTLTAKSLMIADLSNELEDPLLTSGDLRAYNTGGWTTFLATTGGPGNALYVTGSGSYKFAINNADIATNPGEQWSFGGRVQNALTGTNTNVYMIVYGQDKNGNNEVAVASPVVPITGWNDFRFSLTVPAGVYRLKWRVVIQAQATGGTAWVVSPYMRRKNGGELIVDGAIKADHLGADSVTANAIDAGAVRADSILSDQIATRHMQFGSIDGTKINGTAIDGKVITGALVRSAESGRRVQLTTAGLQQFDDDENVILSIGDQNKFTGSVDATNMTIRDGLELFGKNNSIKTGAQVVLATGQGGSAIPPGLSNFYEVSTASVGSAFEVTQGIFTDANEGTIYRASAFFGSSWLYRGATKWQYNKITQSDGSQVSEYNVNGYTRIKTSAGERVVTVGSVNLPGQAPGSLNQSVDVRIYNDLGMTASVAPIPLASPVSFAYAPFAFNRSMAVGKLWGSASWGNQFCLGEMINDGSGTSTVRMQVHSLAGDTSRTMNVDSTVSFATDSGEYLTGITYGNCDALSIVNAATAVWVIQTNKRNVVWLAADLTAAGRRTQYEWPVTPTEQMRAFTTGDINNSLTGFARFNNIAGGANVDAASTQKIVRYSNAAWTGTENPIWAQFAWKGHSSKVAPEWLTAPSTMSSSLYRIKRANVRITVPPLPTPVGGVGSARDVNKDVYSWRYYVGQKATQPLRTEMRLQGNVPSGEPTAVSSLTLPETINLASANPLVATTGFTTATPAKLVSSAGDVNGPFLEVDGDGNLKGKTGTFANISVTGRVTVGTAPDTIPLLPQDASITVNAASQVVRDGRTHTIYFDITATNARSANTALVTFGTAGIPFRPPSRVWFEGIDNASGAALKLYLEPTGIVMCTTARAAATITKGSGTYVIP